MLCVSVFMAWGKSFDMCAWGGMSFGVCARACTGASLTISHSNRLLGSYEHHHPANEPGKTIGSGLCVKTGIPRSPCGAWQRDGARVWLRWSGVRAGVLKPRAKRDDTSINHDPGLRCGSRRKAKRVNKPEPRVRQVVTVSLPACARRGARVPWLWGYKLKTCRCRGAHTAAYVWIDICIVTWQ